MAKVILTADGQTLEIEDEIAGDDKLLRKALATAYPDVTNADLKRTTVNNVMEVRVTKRAGTKGGPFAELLAAKEQVNPALLEGFRILGADLKIAAIQRRAKAITLSCELGDRMSHQINAQLGRLQASPAAPAIVTPEGF